ncbi:hypothetical protein Q3G72_009159 [Acer saccharum]|nr:hypothetical protein Q3G72_009159 [Acer saccharum]
MVTSLKSVDWREVFWSSFSGYSSAVRQMSNNILPRQLLDALILVEWGPPVVTCTIISTVAVTDLVSAWVVLRESLARFQITAAVSSDHHVPPPIKGFVAWSLSPFALLPLTALDLVGLVIDEDGGFIVLRRRDREEIRVWGERRGEMAVDEDKDVLCLLGF